jgi:steroid delta-isomerase-like uncharacterized protein
VPLGQRCFVRMRFIMLRRQGRLILQLGRADTAAASDGCGELEPPFDRESPAALLVRAVGSCHAEELGVALCEGSLSWSAIEVQTDAACRTLPSAPCVDTVTIYSTIYGGDPTNRGRYAAASMQARDRSLIGRTIRGTVAYKVGTVTVVLDEVPDALLPRAGADIGRASALLDVPDAFVNRHLAAFNGHRHETVAAMLHPDCTLEDVALGRLLQGRPAVVDYYRNWWDGFDLRVTGAHCHRSGAETLAVEAHCVGTHAGTFRGVAPTHRRIDLRVAAVLCCRDGLMADTRIYYDAVTLYYQLGIATCTP